MKSKVKAPEMEKAPKVKSQVRPIEKISYGVYFFGQGIIFTIVSQYLMLYYTDYIFISPAIVTAIMFGGKIWDAVNDMLFGMIVDKVRFKSGNRFLPWIRVSTFLIPVSTVLLFLIDKDMSMGVKVTLAIVTYLVWDSAYTICDAPIYALNTAMTQNVKERGTIMTFSGMGGAVATALTTIVFVPYFNDHGFLNTSILIAVLGFATMIWIGVFGKERYRATDVHQEQSASLRDTWIYLKGNKYLLYFYAYRLISGSIAVSMISYMSIYCLGSVEYTSKITLLSIPLIAVLYLLSPFILKKFNKIHIYRFCVIGEIIVNFATWMIGYENKTVTMMMCAIVLAFAILPLLCNGVIPADAIEYGTYKTGKRKEGITFAIQTFANKFTAAIATGLSGLVLTFLNFQAESYQVNGEVMLNLVPQSVIDGIWNANFLVPMIGKLVAIGFLFAYNLKDKDVQIMSDVNAGKLTREEAETMLSRKY